MKVKEIKNQFLKPTEPVLKGRNMGIGDLGSPDVTFVRQFRWTLESKRLNPAFVRKFDIDYIKRELYVEIYEAVVKDGQGISVHDWLVHLMQIVTPHDNLTFTTYDGCGVPLYRQTFKNPTLLEDTASFDYSLSDPSVRKVKLQYQDMGYEYMPKAVEEPMTWWAVQEKSFSLSPIPVEIKDNPKLEIEETQLDFLNAKTWIPGKAKWLPLTIRTDNKHRIQLLSLLGSGADFDLQLKQGSKLIEVWRFKYPRLMGYGQEKDDVHRFDVRLEQVIYNPENDA